MPPMGGCCCCWPGGPERGRGHVAEAGLALQTVGAGVVMEDGGHLQLEGLVDSQQLAVAGYHVLLLLLAAFEIVLLLCGQGPAEAGEGAEQGGHHGSAIAVGQGAAGEGGLAVGDADLGHEEGFAGVADAAD